MPLIRKKSDQRPSADSAPQSLAIALSTRKAAMTPKSAGGPMASEPSDAEQHYGSIADAILAKAKQTKSMDKGMADDNAMEAPMDSDASRKAPEDLYDLDISSQPDDSNEIGDSEESDSENQDDMISSIRKKMKAKRME